MEHKNETKECQNCKKDFIIESDDFSFYEKIQVPPPTFCPECRLIRRLAYREARPLHKNTCNLCHKELVSILAEDSGTIVYCSSCWWSDKWEALDFGIDYDFSKPFFEQFYKLQKIVPREATSSKNCERCEYSNGNVRCKDCLLAFDCLESINCYSSQVAILSRDCIDVDNVMNADHAYECLSSNNIYNSKYIYLSNECIDCNFLYNCVGCTNCFGCVNLRNKKYHIWNKPYSKKEYEIEIKKLDLKNYDNVLFCQKKFLDLYNQTPQRFALIKNSSNVTGNDIQHTKNCQNCFFTRNGVENCKYVFAVGLLLKDSYDATFGGDKSELFYEMNGGMQSQRCFFSRAPNDCRDIFYSNRIFNCSNLFGCVNLRNKNYCIFNKQYKKEEYFIMVEKIKKQMNELPYVDRKGLIYKYGEYFPAETSFWGYNESWAHKYFPLTKEEALGRGYNWKDDPQRDYEATIKGKDLPNNLDEIDDSILNEIIECEHHAKDCNQQCTGFFKILPNELQFYRQIQVALPRICPMCRHFERLKFLYPLKLWHRKCMCDKKGHHHDGGSCTNVFETSHDPDKNRIVYCEDCYQSEFI
jgi:hypothetical protein